LIPHEKGLSIEGVGNIFSSPRYWLPVVLYVFESAGLSEFELASVL